MQRKFVGFDSNGGVGERERRVTGVPGAFFTQLLPQITNPNELKTLLYIMYLASQKRGEPKWVGYWELAEAADLLTGLRKGGDPRPAIEHLREALELCLARSSIVRVEAAPPPPEFFGNAPAKGELEPVTVTWFLLNTAGNREFLASLERGDIKVEQTSLLYGLDLWDWPLPDSEGAASGADSAVAGSTANEIQNWRTQQQWRVRSSRPDIFTLYEQNIGPLTPILSERLKDSEKLYPAAWVEEAFAEAVNYNRRSWAYIARILENWAANGRERNQANEQRARPAASPPAQRAGRDGRTPVAGDGNHPPAAKSTARAAPARGSSTPTRPRGPIDFTKYTTGKYAHLTGATEQPAAPEPEPGSLE